MAINTDIDPLTFPMDPTDPGVAYDFSPMFRVYKDGRTERIMGTEIVPPSLDSKTNIESKDVLYSSEENLSVRLYIPKSTQPNQKLPVLVYIHGGAFVIETAFSPVYHSYLNTLVAEANLIAVSVDYRRAPEHPVPIPYDDSWTALTWVASHFDGNGPEDWLNSHADFGKVFLAGDSAGANIAHHMAMRVGREKPEGINVVGIVMVHPYFWGIEPVGDEEKDPDKRSKVEALWRVESPNASGCDDPLLNVTADGSSLARLGCSRVLVCVAEKDILRYRGFDYYEKLGKSGWGGVVEIMVAEGEQHVFHLFNPRVENATLMLKRTAAFVNQ